MRWSTFAGAYAGLWLLTQAATPKSIRTMSEQQSADLLERLSDYRCPFGAPISMMVEGIVRTSFWKGKPGELMPGEMSAPAMVRQALDAGRFVFVESSATSRPLPSKFSGKLVKPQSVRAFMNLHPSWTLFAAPSGYMTDGRRM